MTNETDNPNNEEKKSIASDNPDLSVPNEDSGLDKPGVPSDEHQRSDTDAENKQNSEEPKKPELEVEEKSASDTDREDRKNSEPLSEAQTSDVASDSGNAVGSSSQTSDPESTQSVGSEAGTQDAKLEKSLASSADRPEESGSETPVSGTTNTEKSHESPDQQERLETKQRSDAENQPIAYEPQEPENEPSPQLGGEEENAESPSESGIQEGEVSKISERNPESTQSIKSEAGTHESPDQDKPQEENVESPSDESGADSASDSENSDRLEKNAESEDKVGVSDAKETELGTGIQPEEVSEINDRTPEPTPPKEQKKQTSDDRNQLAMKAAPATPSVSKEVTDDNEKSLTSFSYVLLSEEVNKLKEQISSLEKQLEEVPELKEQISSLEKQLEEVPGLKEQISSLQAQLQEMEKIVYRNVKAALNQDREQWEKDVQEFNAYREEFERSQQWGNDLQQNIKSVIRDCQEKLSEYDRTTTNLTATLTPQLQHKLQQRQEALELIGKMLARLPEQTHLSVKNETPCEELPQISKSELMELVKGQDTEKEVELAIQQKLKQVGDRRWQLVSESRKLAEGYRKGWLNFVEKKVLPILDGIDDGEKYLKELKTECPNDSKILAPLLQLHDELRQIVLKMLESASTRPMKVQTGQPIDYNRHEPFDAQPNEALKNEDIIEVTRKGYEYQSEGSQEWLLLRPAQVIVVKNN